MLGMEIFPFILGVFFKISVEIIMVLLVLEILVRFQFYKKNLSKLAQSLDEYCMPVFHFTLIAPVLLL